ncbi:MAG TPA: 5-formyltetrahydrofolate cyclo-ligase [Anaeromyxobacteraceae bacterium]|nr:5-formyltetrahydrofolate cyclo-ligase [Anaeromyxobacteraceae bacterium]
MDNGEAKRVLRERLVRIRAALPEPARAAAARACAGLVEGLPAWKRARTVALYAPIGAEVDTSELVRRALAGGKRVAWPVLRAGRVALDFAACAPEELVAGALGTREPPASALAVPPAEIDLVVVPGVAFDESGNRLGRGRGHYDATLAGLPGTASRVGLAFEIQLVPLVPREDHDAPLDAVVTERRVCAASRPLR